MFPIGRLTNSVASISNELTVAAANFNIDFTLLKVEAPLEYQRLGTALSMDRRKQAEIGSAHTTARKLGALFEQILPETPRLFKAYGQRASDVADSTASSPVENRTSGPFASYVGVDGTSIWAAATSGKHAIAVHLLACMLARMWTRPEAISIWVEIVERRKQQIMTEFDQSSSQDMASFMAAQQEITREHLSLWDSSARAWLQSSDNAHRIQQTQLRLVVDNVKYPVNNENDLYQSVIKAWIDAMTLVEALISGLPQRVRNGAILLGLLSWHIYPDMLVLGQTTLEIKQKDTLVGDGGILTIGLQHGIQEDNSGVIWSLPLAHMRYYGSTPIASQALALYTSRVSINQLFQVVLGSLSANWEVDTKDAAEFIVALYSAIQRNIQKGPVDGLDLMEHKYRCLEPQHWFKDLAEAAKQFTCAKEPEKQILMRLAAFGARRARNFLCPSLKRLRSGFALTDLRILFPLLADDGQRIKLLRRCANRYQAYNSNMIIRYKPLCCISNEGTLESLSSEGPPVYYEYATAIKRRQSFDRANVSSQLEESTHNRWIVGHPMTEQEKYLPHPLKMGICKCLCRTEEKPCYGDFECPCCLDRTHLCEKRYQLQRDETQEGVLTGIIEMRRANLEDIGEVPLYVESDKIQELQNGTIEWQNFGSEERMSPRKRRKTAVIHNPRDLDAEYDIEAWDKETDALFDFLLGDVHSAALFQRRSDKSSRERKDESSFRIPLNDVSRVLSENTIISKALDEHLQQWGTLGSSLEDAENFTKKSLKAMSTVKYLYDDLADATVALEVIREPLINAEWLRDLGDEDEEDVFKLDLKSAFSCIAMFESGKFNIQPTQLDRVVAMAAGNSIYVAGLLINDPGSTTTRSKLKRVVGNVGRAVMAMLTTPTKPKVKPLQFDSWNLINHAEFDGNMHDSFQNTTLHLSFTDFEMALNVEGAQGIRDTEVSLLESIVSVHDSGEWVGDIDVVSLLDSSESSQISIKSQLLARSLASCSHSQLERAFRHTADTPTIISLDSWEEFFDLPQKAVNTIFRGRSNWVARLAAATFNANRKLTTIILPEDMCWTCYQCSLVAEEHYTGKFMLMG